MTTGVDSVLELLGRSEGLFSADLAMVEHEVRSLLSGSRVLVIGAAGSIGQAVCREVFRRSPRALHAVDLSENNLVELVRDIRSTLGYIEGDFRTLALDAASPEYRAFVASQAPYDYVLNLSALKHVRSEKDAYTLMRMINVNVFNAEALALQAARDKCRRFFSVSTDKAADPVSMMGATKRIMELFLLRASACVPVALARFANVAFSDGSLLHGLRQRFEKRQPIAAPRDIRRYMMTDGESGVLCLLACLLCDNRDLFIPKLDEQRDPMAFPDIVRRFLARHGYDAAECDSEEEARSRVDELLPQKRWPCWFFESDTTGEKDVEVFCTAAEHPDFSRFERIGVVHLRGPLPLADLERFANRIAELRAAASWTKEDLVEAVQRVLPDFVHDERHRYLDQRM